MTHPTSSHENQEQPDNRIQTLSEQLTAITGRVQALEKMYNQTYNELRYLRGLSNCNVGSRIPAHLASSPLWTQPMQTQFPGGPFFYPPQNSLGANYPVESSVNFATKTHLETKDRIIAILSRLGDYPPALQQLIFPHMHSWLKIVSEDLDQFENPIQLLSQRDLVVEIYNKAVDVVKELDMRQF